MRKQPNQFAPLQPDAVPLFNQMFLPEMISTSHPSGGASRGYRQLPPPPLNPVYWKSRLKTEQQNNKAAFLIQNPGLGFLQDMILKRAKLSLCGVC